MTRDHWNGAKRNALRMWIRLGYDDVVIMRELDRLTAQVRSSGFAGGSMQELRELAMSLPSPRWSPHTANAWQVDQCRAAGMSTDEVIRIHKSDWERRFADGGMYTLADYCARWGWDVE